MSHSEILKQFLNSKAIKLWETRFQVNQITKITTLRIRCFLNLEILKIVLMFVRILHELIIMYVR